MDILITIGGLILGASFFLYLLNAYDSGSRKLRKVRGHAAGNVAGTAVLAERALPGGSVKTIVKRGYRSLPEDLKDGLPQRICPMCSKTLKRDEPLYASNMVVGKVKKVFIHGCPYCYKGA